MENIGNVKLLATNELHMRKRALHGTEVAGHESVNNMSMFDRSTFNCSKNVLDYLAVKQKVVASNVANINTPGYKTKDVSFASVLESKNKGLRLGLKRTNPRHFPKGDDAGEGIETFYAYAPHGSAARGDGRNDVDIDKEMLKVGDIQTNFAVFSKILSDKYKGVDKVINAQ